MANKEEQSFAKTFRQSVESATQNVCRRLEAVERLRTVRTQILRDTMDTRLSAENLNAFIDKFNSASEPAERQLADIGRTWNELLNQTTESLKINQQQVLKDLEAQSTIFIHRMEMSGKTPSQDIPATDLSAEDVIDSAFSAEESAGADNEMQQ